MKKLLVKAVISILPLLVFSGCAMNQQPKSNYFTSKISESSKLSESESITLANDFTEFINVYYLPSKTQFYVNTKDIDSTFFKTIDSKLRSKGYGLTFDNKAKDVNYLSWHISKLKPEVLRATYNIDTSRVTKMYKRNEDNLSSYGSFTAINLKEKVVTIELPDLDQVGELEKEVIIDSLIGTVKAHTLRIRKNATTRSKVLGYLKKNETVTIDYITTTSNGYRWAKLLDQDGYVSDSYIRY